MMTTDDRIQAASRRMLSLSVSKAFFIASVMLWLRFPASLVLIFVIDYGVESVDLVGADGDGAGLEDGAVHVVETGRGVFAGFGIVVGAGAPVGVAAVDEGFACECIEKSVYPAATGEQCSSDALIGIGKIFFVVCHTPHSACGKWECEHDIGQGVKNHQFGCTVDFCVAAGLDSDRWHYSCHSCSESKEDEDVDNDCAELNDKNPEVVQSETIGLVLLSSPAPGASTNKVSVSVFDWTNDAEKQAEGPHGDHSDDELYMTNTTAFDCGVEGVKGDSHDEESRGQIANVE